MSTEETNICTHRHVDSAVKGLKNLVVDEEIYKSSHCTKSKYKLDQRTMKIGLRKLF